jgi:hypothetical protein
MNIRGDYLKGIFESIIRKQENLMKRNNCLFNLMGYIKLLLFVTFGATIYFMFTRWDNTIFKIAVAILFVLQIGSWIYHAKIGDKIAHSTGIIEINRRHLARLTGKWTEFPDIGEEFIDPEHPYGCDLDIVGKKSLFQFLNTTHTWHGRHAFADDLLHAAYSKEEVRRRQEAVAELAENNEFASELEYRFSKIGNDPAAHSLAQELKDAQPFMKNRILRTILTYGPLFIILFAGLTAIFHWEQFYLPSAILFIFQALIWLIGLPATFRYIKSVNQLPFKLNAYGEVLDFVNAKKFTALELRQIQSNLTTSDISAAQAIKELAKIADKVSVRNNPLVYFILNMLLLWDYECAFMFEDWNAKYSPHCDKWFLSLGGLESLLCFATMKKVCEQTCFPYLLDTRGVEAKNLGHPLISNASRVTNPLRLNNNILVISGSNMSGKTTYLRTVGINIVLARAGGPVCAKEMVCSDLHIITSMRIADDLNEGISTFYAELKRIKRILDASEHNHGTLFLIDEIFRGTNSVDRLSGAKVVIMKLSQLKAIGMVTTHDLELCDLQQKVPRIQNYSFSEYYENMKICFDYKIRHGKAKTTNAKHLMELIGII